MPILWQWDQGRVRYWRYDNLREIATQLATHLDGVNLHKRGNDPLEILRRATGLPFKTTANRSYSIWRQYARLFGSVLLASRVGDQLTATDICKRLAGLGGPPLLADEYLVLLTKRFYLPSPAFDRYSPSNKRVYPFSALIRYLIAQQVAGEEPQIDIKQVFALLIGNDIVGNETHDRLAHLPDSRYRPADKEELRQVREMMPLISQFSFLLWDGKVLRLDPRGRDIDSLVELSRMFLPQIQQQESRRELELLELGKITAQQGGDLTLAVDAFSAFEEEIEFVEGARIRVTHLRAERNGALRRAFLDHRLRSQSPILCDMCTVDLIQRYPWAANLLEVHHLLPLGSTLRIEPKGTSFTDLVPICPNCHRAVHVFYREWLRQAQKPDFDDEQDARRAYANVKTRCHFN